MAADSRNRRTQQTQASALGQIVGIMAGGALGIVMGYWLLNLIGGPNYNFLQVPLPFIAEADKAAVQTDPPAVDVRIEMPSTPRSTNEHPAPIAATPLPPAVEPRVLTPPPVAFPRYTADDLAEALSAANVVAGCENCQATGFIKKGAACPICGGKPSGRITAEVYAKFCRLSDVITFVELRPGDPPIADRRAAIEQVFLRATVDREKQAALGRMASHHFKNPQAPTSGILLAGTVQELGQSGDFHWARLVLFGLGDEIIVVSESPVRAQPQARMLVAGSIVDRPRERLAGYTGTAARVVLGGFPLVLPETR